jgi:PhnB protein
MQPSPVVTLNRAVAVSKVAGPGRLSERHAPPRLWKSDGGTTNPRARKQRRRNAMPEDQATATRSDAAVMRGVIPYVGFAGRAGEALDFYARAFGATELGRMPDAQDPARLMHGQVEINGGAFMVTDTGCERGEVGVGALHMQLVVEDGRHWWDRAVAAGCTIAEPYRRQFWGDDWGMLVDPFGIRWAVLQPGPDHAA